MIVVVPLIFTAVMCIVAYIFEKVVCFIACLFILFFLSVLLILLSLSF